MIHGDCKCYDCERERDRERKRGVYWLTEEGRAEIRDTWDGANDGDSIPRTLLDAVEAHESDLASLRAAVEALADTLHNETVQARRDDRVSGGFMERLIDLAASLRSLLRPGGDDASREG